MDKARLLLQASFDIAAIVWHSRLLKSYNYTHIASGFQWHYIHITFTLHLHYIYIPVTLLICIAMAGLGAPLS